jgi:hypothetical protein
VNENDFGVPSELRKEPTGDPARTVNAMALVGFAGPGGQGCFCLYPDVNFQRWLEIPESAVVFDAPLTNFNTGRPCRRIVWVKSEWLLAPMFDDALSDEIAQHFNDGGRMSTWPLVPGSRLVAAESLDLVPHLAYDKKDT